mmetsp:Transcript_35450/g.57177  ORF Transcript_35450/g.57177 Transcript_35450/m.57177 type:complete len:101 (-) Transcript_35450:265-567(-)
MPGGSRQWIAFHTKRALNPVQRESNPNLRSTTQYRGGDLHNTDDSRWTSTAYSSCRPYWKIPVPSHTISKPPGRHTANIVEYHAGRRTSSEAQKTRQSPR